MSIVIDKITPPAPEVSKRVTEKNENKGLIETKNDTVTCHYNSIDANAGTELILDLNLIFYNNILDTYQYTAHKRHLPQSQNPKTKNRLHLHQMPL